MPHIHTQPGQHDLTTSAFIIRTDGDKPKAVLHLHKKLNVYMQFGGHVELHENPWQAITHEIREESGYDLDQLTLLQPTERLISSKDTLPSVVHPYPFAVQTHPIGNIEHNHTDISYAFVTDQPPRNQPDDGEATDFMLLDIDELRALPIDKMPANVLESFIFVLETCLPNWEQVPAHTVVFQ